MLNRERLPISTWAKRKRPLEESARPGGSAERTSAEGPPMRRPVVGRRKTQGFRSGCRRSGHERPAGTVRKPHGSSDPLGRPRRRASGAGRSRTAKAQGYGTLRRSGWAKPGQPEPVIQPSAGGVRTPGALRNTATPAANRLVSSQDGGPVVRQGEEGHHPLSKAGDGERPVRSQGFLRVRLRSRSPLL